MTDQFDIIISGHLCLDLIPDMSGVTSEGMTTPGRLLETGPIGISTGGVVSNTGLALHRLGAKTGIMATVGDDLLGRVIIASLYDDHHHRRQQQVGQVAPFTYATLDDIDQIITTEYAPADEVTAFREAGVTVTTVPVGS